MPPSELKAEQEKAAHTLLSALECEQEPGDLHGDFDTTPGTTTIIAYVEFLGKKWDDDNKRYLIKFRFGSSKNSLAVVRSTYESQARSQSGSVFQHRKDAMDNNAYVIVAVDREVVMSEANDAINEAKYAVEQPLARMSEKITGTEIEGIHFECINKKFDLSGLLVNRQANMVSVLAFVMCSDTPQLTQSPNRESQSVVYTLKWPREILRGFEPLLKELGLSSRARVFCYVGSNNTPVRNRRPSTRTSPSPLRKDHTEYLNKEIDFEAIRHENTVRMRLSESNNDTSKFVRLVKAVGFDLLFQSDYVTIVPVSSATSQKDVREAEQAEIDKINGQRGYELLNGMPAATTTIAKMKRKQLQKQNSRKSAKLRRKRDMSFG